MSQYAFHPIKNALTKRGEIDALAGWESLKRDDIAIRDAP
jgi:hypothetical protein